MDEGLPFPECCRRTEKHHIDRVENAEAATIPRCPEGGEVRRQPKRLDRSPNLVDLCNLLATCWTPPRLIQTQLGGDRTQARHRVVDCSPVVGLHLSSMADGLGAAQHSPDLGGLPDRAAPPHPPRRLLRSRPIVPAAPLLPYHHTFERHAMAP